ncbi:uncharacterized protein LODBEIA_P05750 [Lodderomyces beijingensis]|uniref:Uncharacterized protein n=1 Tax=Lodderomyces beijingensis TaxID=1775926 RepID=A0ABP0ZGS9_9ASCO
MLTRSIKQASKQSLRLQSASSSQLTAKRFNSSHHDDRHHHHEPKEEKPFEITITKIFGIAALLGGVIMYRGKDSTEEPLFKSGLFEQETNGQRAHLRDVNFEQRYKLGFIKTYINDNGGKFGNQIYRRTKGEDILNNNLVPAHSPYGHQIGAGIKLNEIGPRRERIPRFAPLGETK